MNATRIRLTSSEGEVTLTQVRDGFTSHLRSSEPDAVALAWKILNDLRPQELDEVLAEENERRRELIRSRMLAMLAVSNCTCAQLSSVLGPPARELSGIIKPMRMTGIVARIDSGGARDRATWALTDKGRALSRPTPDGGRRAA